MITFRSTEDLAKLPTTDSAYPTVQELVDRLITAYTKPGGFYPDFTDTSIQAMDFPRSRHFVFLL